MEYIIGAAVIVILLLILGFGIDTIIFGFFVLLLIMTAASELFFLYAVIRLILAKRCTGRFSHIGKKREKGYDTAYYTIDGSGGDAVPNVFPAEFVMKDKLYKPENAVRLRLDIRKRFVFDRNARITIILGVPLCAVLCGIIAFSLLFVLKNYP